MACQDGCWEGHISWHQDLRRLPALLNPHFCCFAKGHKKVVLRSFWFWEVIFWSPQQGPKIWRLSQNHHPAYGCRTQITTPPLDAEPKPPPNWPSQAHTCTQPVGTNSCLFPGLRWRMCTVLLCTPIKTGVTE